MHIPMPDNMEALKQLIQHKPEFEQVRISIDIAEKDLARPDRQDILARARRKYAEPSNDNLEIDEDAQFSDGDEGTWVQAWVWLAKEDDAN